MVDAFRAQLDALMGVNRNGDVVRARVASCDTADGLVKRSRRVPQRWTTATRACAATTWRACVPASSSSTRYGVLLRFGESRRSAGLANPKRGRFPRLRQYALCALRRASPALAENVAGRLRQPALRATAGACLAVAAVPPWLPPVSPPAVPSDVQRTRTLTRPTRLRAR
jgi:hypothetical protein